MLPRKLTVISGSTEILRKTTLKSLVSVNKVNYIIINYQIINSNNDFIVAV